MCASDQIWEVPPLPDKRTLFDQIQITGGGYRFIYPVPWRVKRCPKFDKRYCSQSKMEIFHWDERYFIKSSNG
jgi:hypothetical protein